MRLRSARQAQGYVAAVDPLFTDASGRTCRDVRETGITKGKETTDIVMVKEI